MHADSAGDLERLGRSPKLGLLLEAQESGHFRTIDDVEAVVFDSGQPG